MGLLEIYFWMVIYFSGFLNFFIITLSEDLKTKKRFKKFLKISFSIGLFGILMVSTDWNYLCGYTCLIFTFSPFITLLILKTVMIIFRKVTKKEGFHFYKGELLDGFYQENLGDIQHKSYYSLYSIFLFVTPLIVLVLFYNLTENITC